MKIEAKLWHLEGEQGFKEIRPSSLVFEPTWPIFKTEWSTSRQTFWKSFMKIEVNLWPLEGEQGFKEI